MQWSLVAPSFSQEPRRLCPFPKSGVCASAQVFRKHHLQSSTLTPSNWLPLNHPLIKSLIHRACVSAAQSLLLLLSQCLPPKVTLRSQFCLFNKSVFEAPWRQGPHFIFSSVPGGRTEQIIGPQMSGCIYSSSSRSESGHRTP